MNIEEAIEKAYGWFNFKKADAEDGVDILVEYFDHMTDQHHLQVLEKLLKSRNGWHPSVLKYYIDKLGYVPTTWKDYLFKAIGEKWISLDWGGGGEGELIYNPWWDDLYWDYRKEFGYQRGEFFLPETPSRIEELRKELEKKGGGRVWPRINRVNFSLETLTQLAEEKEKWWWLVDHWHFRQSLLVGEE